MSSKNGLKQLPFLYWHNQLRFNILNRLSSSQDNLFALLKNMIYEHHITEDHCTLLDLTHNQSTILVKHRTDYLPEDWNIHLAAEAILVFQLTDKYTMEQYNRLQNQFLYETPLNLPDLYYEGSLAERYTMLRNVCNRLNIYHFSAPKLTSAEIQEVATQLMSECTTSEIESTRLEPHLLYYLADQKSNKLWKAISLDLGEPIRTIRLSPNSNPPALILGRVEYLASEYEKWMTMIQQIILDFTFMPDPTESDACILHVRWQNLPASKK